jgi:hypothetical protein
MHPALAVQALWIVTVKQVLSPFPVIRLGRIGRPGNMRLAAAAEFGLVPFTAPGALDSQHDVRLCIC